MGNFPIPLGCLPDRVCPIFSPPLLDPKPLSPIPGPHLDPRAMTDMTPPPDGPRAPRLPRISFEFFPPKTEEMERNLWDTIKRLAPLNPNFVSVTYGAGGSTRERTHATIVRMLKETDLLPAAHLTCVGASRAEIDEVVDRYHDAGVRHIVPLRGDPATGTRTALGPHPHR